MIKQYMVKVYAFLIKAGKRDIDSLPDGYKLKVAEHLASLEENQ